MAKPKTATSTITRSQVSHVAALANLPLTPSQVTTFQPELASVLKLVSSVNRSSTTKTPETTQVTGLENVLRPDRVDTSRVLTQKQALNNAAHTHRGYFVVPATIDQS